MLDESEPERLTNGAMASISPNAGETNFLRRASDQFRLPKIVLISPLCANILNGCANGHCGKVLVEKR